MIWNTDTMAHTCIKLCSQSLRPVPGLGSLLSRAPCNNTSAGPHTEELWRICKVWEVSFPSWHSGYLTTTKHISHRRRGNCFLKTGFKSVHNTVVNYWHYQAQVHQLPRHRIKSSPANQEGPKYTGSDYIKDTLFVNLCPLPRHCNIFDAHLIEACFDIYLAY